MLYVGLAFRVVSVGLRLTMGGVPNLAPSIKERIFPMTPDSPHVYVDIYVCIGVLCQKYAV